jgi:hypothetical protein
MPPVPHQRLLNEAARLATEEVLRHLPCPYSPALEATVYQAVRRGIWHYGEGLDTLSRQLHPLDQGRKASGSPAAA